MDDLRLEIDLLDKDIQSLLDRRLSIVEKIAAIKKEQGLNIKDTAREYQIIKSILENRDIKYNKEIANIYKNIFAISIDREKEIINKKISTKCYLLGKDISYSVSQYIHENFGYSYDIKDIDNEKVLEEFLMKRNFIFCNVTTPYKKTVIKYLDDMNDIAKISNSVNLIINEDGKLIGYNTDYLGFLDAMRNKKFSIKGKSFILLGNGATSNTIYSCLKDNGASNINVISRGGENNYDNIEKFKGSDYLINATIVGSERCYKDIVDLKKLDIKKGVIDINYSPLKSKLIMQAEKLNLPYMNGYSMLYYQALHTSLISGLLKNDNINKEPIINDAILKRINIVLIGMPGSGKTYIGQKLSREYNMCFIDLDLEIEKLLDMPVKDIFKNYGEEYFRLLESFLTKHVLSKKRGYVISLGGGAILDHKNVESLENNAIFVNIINRKRLNSQEIDKRPVFNDITFNELLKIRKPIYKSVADIEYENKECNGIYGLITLISDKIREIYN